MFEYRVSQIDRGNGTDSEWGWPACKTYRPLVVGHGACRCRTIVHVKSEDVSFTLLVMTGCCVGTVNWGVGSGDCWLNAPRQTDCWVLAVDRLWLTCCSCCCYARTWTPTRDYREHLASPVSLYSTRAYCLFTGFKMTSANFSILLYSNTKK